MNPTTDQLKSASYRDTGGFISSMGSGLLLSFLNRELRSQSDLSLDREYPSLFLGVPGGESLYIERAGEIISHVGFVVRDYQHPFFKIKIGLIGSVITRKENRGEGLASYLLQEANQKLEKQGCVLSLLWSDQPQFYSPLGFFRSGSEWDFKVSIGRARKASVCARPLNQEHDMERVWSLYQSKTAKIERTKQEMAALINIPKTQLYVTETHGVVDSYIAINKGADFTHYIHEWAGEIEVVKKSILDCQNRFFSNTPLTLIAPLENESSKFLDISEQNWKGSLGLVKILNHQALLACMDSFCKKSSIPLHLEQQKPLSEEELLLLALGRDGITSPTCLPLFLWGFDSI